METTGASLGDRLRRVNDVNGILFSSQGAKCVRFEESEGSRCKNKSPWQCVRCIRGGKKASGRVETARVREVPKKAKSKQEQKQQQPKSSPSLGTQAKRARQPRRWYSKVLVRGRGHVHVSGLLKSSSASSSSSSWTETCSCSGLVVDKDDTCVNERLN